MKTKNKNKISLTKCWHTKCWHLMNYRTTIIIRMSTFEYIDYRALNYNVLI